LSYCVRYTQKAQEDIVNLYQFLVDTDIEAARKAIIAIKKGLAFLQDFPFTCRKVNSESSFLREMIIPFGSHGYVVLFEIEDNSTVTILAVRHQREDDYH